jgi:hypothetical protein
MSGSLKKAEPQGCGTATDWKLPLLAGHNDERTAAMNRKKIATVLAMAAVAVVGSSAFTAGGFGGSIPATTMLASSTTTVTGAVANSVAYTYDVAGTHVATITVVLNGDTHASPLSVTPNYDVANNGVDVLGTPVFDILDTADLTDDGPNGLYDGTTETTYVFTVAGAQWLLRDLDGVNFAIA